MNKRHTRNQTSASVKSMFSQAMVAHGKPVQLYDALAVSAPAAISQFLLRHADIYSV